MANENTTPDPYQQYWDRRKQVKTRMAALLEAATLGARAQAELVFADYLGKLSDKVDLDPGDAQAFQLACRGSLAQALGGSISGRLHRGAYHEDGMLAEEIVRVVCQDHEQERSQQL